MTTLLTFDEVSFGFTGRPVLRGASFGLEEGSMTALVGPNGIGKTTLLRLATGILAPSSGRVFLGGMSLANLALRERARQMSLVPQRLEVPFRFTVQQIVEQGRTPFIHLLRGLTREDRMAVDRAMELTSIVSLRRRIFNELSGGERQRVKIALGLAQQPRVLLLDEPTQSLDVGRQAELLDLLQALRSEGITILASMHDLHHIPGIFSGVLLLGRHQRLLEGLPEDILSAENVEWAFDLPPGRAARLGDTMYDGVHA